MKIFKLPDLGEGLPDAIIREWYIHEGDEIKVDQPMVAMETAKALVDVPSPFTGKIEKLFGKTGDTIETGQPLVGFEGEGSAETTHKDSGTVVGSIEESGKVLKESAVGVVATGVKQHAIKATPAVRALAKRLGVNLETLTPAGERITAEEVEKASSHAAPTLAPSLAPGMEILSPARRAMVLSMSRSHQEIVPVMLCDDADIQAWDKQQDFTIRMLRAIAAACKKEPNLNIHYDGKNMAFLRNENVNVGIAVDTAHGLYVPVLRDIDQQTDAEIRAKVDQYKQQAETKSITQADLHGATIMLSNFGTFAGRYASPILVPPIVAIVAVGRSRDEVVAVKGTMAIHKILPLSLTFDHRAVTGGEAARFLRVLIDELAKPAI